MSLPAGAKYIVGWVYIISGVSMVVSSIIVSFYDQFTSIGSAVENYWKEQNKKNQKREFYALHKYLNTLDGKTYEKEISIV